MFIPCALLLGPARKGNEAGEKHRIASHCVGKEKKRHFTGVGLGFLNNEKESI